VALSEYRGHCLQQTVLTNW